MSYRVEREQGKIVIFFTGRMDTKVCGDVHAAVLEEVDSKTALGVVFDLEAVDYVSSSFLRLCSAAANRMGEKKLEVRSPVPFVRKVFQTAGFDRFIDIN